MKKDGRLQDKVAVVVGMATGIGASTVRLFAAEGAKVIGADINEDKGKLVTEEIKATGGDTIFIKTDVTLEEDIKNLMEAVETKYNKIDVLVTCVGGPLLGFMGKFKHFWEYTSADWDMHNKVNAKSHFLAIKYAFPGLVKSGAASVITISSMCSQQLDDYSMLYSTNKEMLRYMSEFAAFELAPYKIRVNSVLPGAVNTPFYNGTGITPEYLDSLQRWGRCATPEEIALSILFLASDESSYTSGASLRINGANFYTQSERGGGAVSGTV